MSILTPTTKPCPISVVIDYQAHRKLTAYINNVANEVSGIGKITRSGNFIYINDVYLISQRVTSASTNLDPEGLSKFYAERLAIDPNDNLAGYKLWWHSHYNFGVFWSGTDEETVNSFDQETEIDNFMLSLVGNQKGEIKIRLDVYSPFRYTYDNIEYVIGADDSEFEEEIKKEIAEKVAGEAPEPPKLTENGNTDLWNEEWDRPEEWGQMTRKQRKLWRALDKKGKRLVKYCYVDDDGIMQKRDCIIPKGTVIVKMTESGTPIYIYKKEGETDSEAKQRYTAYMATDYRNDDKYFDD